MINIFKKRNIAVMDYVRALPYVNKDNIFLMGCSQGGFVSVLVAAKNKYPIKKLCLFYPALCIPDDARAGKMMMAKFDPNNVPELLNYFKKDRKKQRLFLLQNLI